MSEEQSDDGENEGGSEGEEMMEKEDFAEYAYPKDLSDFQLAALGVVRNIDNPYGLRIMHSMEELIERDINPGQLYPNLDELAEKGLIDITAKDDRTNLYHLTRRGELVMGEYRRFIDDTYPEPRT